MAPYSIPLADQKSEIDEKISKLQDKILMNNDLREDLEEQIEDNCYELSNITLRYELFHRDSDEHKQLVKEETRLRNSSVNANTEIGVLRIEKMEILQQIDQLKKEMSKLK